MTTNLRFASRMEKLSFSASLASIRKARELRLAGITVTDFGSKFDTPAHVKEAAAKFLLSSAAAAYADPRGLSELREAITRKLARENALKVDPETEITVSGGGKQGILATLLALVGTGDEVIIEDPGWLSFEPMVRISGATPVPLPLDEKNGFRFSIDDLKKRITDKTRLLILCNPHNPTGRLLNRDELAEIARVVLERDLLVIVDEAYEHFVYDGRPFVSFATIENMRDRTITVQTASKTFNMFGWRVGWVIASPAISARIQMISSHSITCVNSVAQIGAAAALDGSIVQGTLTLPELVRNYQAQRDAMVAGLNAIPQVSCTMPEGAYFVFPDISRTGMSSQDLREKLYDEARIVSLPGPVFGARGEGHLRLVFNAPLPDIQAGVAIMQKFFRTL